MKVNIPPIKSRGIKTKLVPWINSIIPYGFKGLWVEPFMGTGVVAFNLSPSHAMLCDTNPHLINFSSVNHLKKTITETINNDIIYCDPPYIERHVDYYNWLG